jgi:hypothetical protein
MVPFDHIPPRKLGLQFFERLALERRNASPAGDAMPFGQFHYRAPFFGFKDLQFDGEIFNLDTV